MTRTGICSGTTLKSLISLEHTESCGYYVIGDNDIYPTTGVRSQLPCTVSILAIKNMLYPAEFKLSLHENNAFDRINTSET